MNKTELEKKMADKTYEQGLTEGKIEALEKMSSTHTNRLNGHSDRLRILERVMWGLLGIVAMVQLWPTFQTFINNGVP